MPTYEPVFCPNCNTTINQLDALDPEPIPSTELVTCGWCKRRHSIEAVKTCRQLRQLSVDRKNDNTMRAYLQLYKQATTDV